MSRKPTDLSNKTLGDIRKMKTQICANLRKAILDVVKAEEDAYGIRLGDLSVYFERHTYETECGAVITSSPDCKVSVGIIGTEL